MKFSVLKTQCRRPFYKIQTQMTLSSFLRSVTSRHPLLLYTSTWTILLTLMVAIASFSPEVAFVSAISTASSFSQACKGYGLRIPLAEDPREVVCLPAQLFRNSTMDFFVPPIFAALIVAGSALVVRSMSLWEEY